jgi:hypothetical protein
MPWGVVAPPTDESQLFYSNIFAASLQNAESNPLPLKDSNVFLSGLLDMKLTYMRVTEWDFASSMVFWARGGS